MTPERWQQIKALFNEALERPDTERAAFLAAACPDDPELREQVASLLTADSAAPAIFDATPAHLAAVLPEADAPAPLALAGRRIGPYRLIRELGRGGMGTVYLAEREDVEMRVALKVLRGGLAAPEQVERFHLERRVLARLDHPCIARLLDAGVMEDGTPWFAMEHVEGEPLDRYCDHRRLPIGARVELFAQVCEAVACAHRSRVVHRDLKPSNILVDESGRAKLLDFGIAKLLEEGAPGEALTGTGMRLMTPEYAAPEQVRGQPVTPATDVYGLGAVLYELLSGHKSLRMHGGSMGELERRLLTDEPPPPSVAATRVEEIVRTDGHRERITPAGVSHARDTEPRRLRRRLAGDLDRIVLKAMEKEPARRYPDAAGLLADLRAHAAGRPISARPATPLYRARKLVRRNPLVVTLATALVALLGALGLWSAGGLEAPDERALLPGHIAVLPFTVHGSGPYGYLGEGMVNLLSTALHGAGELRSVDPRALLAVLRAEAEGERGVVDPQRGQQLAARFGAGVFILGDVTEAQGRLRLTAALYDGSRRPARLVEEAAVEGEHDRLLALVDELAARLLAGRSRGPGARLARTATLTTHSLPALKAYLEGESHWRAGRYPTAVNALQQAVELDTTFALAHLRLSSAAHWIQREDLAFGAARAAVRHSARLSEPDRLLVSAWERYLAAEPDSAERLYRAVLAVQPDNLEAWFQLGEVLFHWRPRLGYSAADAHGAFERVLAYEPNHVGALLHLARLAAVAGKREELDSLAAHVLRLDPGRDAAREITALRAFALGDRAEEQRILGLVARADEPDPAELVKIVAAHAYNPAGAAELARAFAAPAHSPLQRAWARIMAAQLELARGRWSASRAELSELESLQPGWALQYRAAYAVFPLLELPRSELQAIRSALLRPQSTYGWSAPGSDPRTPRAIYPPRRLYLLGLLDLRLGEAAGAEQYAAELEHFAGTPTDSAFSRSFAGILRAQVAAAWGDSPAALALLRLPHRSPGALQPSISSFPTADARFLRAELLRALGREEEALRWYTSFPDPAGYDLHYLAPSHLRRAEIHERRGEREQAVEHYRRFIELWKDADPELQPLVREVNERLAGLERPRGG